MASALHELFLEEFRLCEIGRGQTVAVLSEGDQLRDYAETSLAAASALGAEVIDVNLNVEHAMDASERIANVGKNPLTEHPQSLQQCCDADIVIDHMLLLFSHEQIAMQKAGARVLLVVEPEEILQRLFPNPMLRQRVEAGERRLANAQRLHFTNAAGTDVTYELGRKPILTEYGYTATAGRWDHWPSGFVFIGGDDDGVDGKIVVASGDSLLPQNIYVREPIVYTIEKGWIQDIRGGLEAELVNAYMSSFDDDRGYGMSHVGWGMNPQAKWHAMSPGLFPGGMGMEARSYLGNVMFSTGPNNELGGSNDTACHLDIPMRGCSLFLDDEAIILDGKMAVQGLQFP